MDARHSGRSEVSSIMSQTIEAISEQFRSPLTLLCGLAFACVIFAFEYLAFVRDRERSRQLTQKRKSNRIQEIHVDFSSEESEEEGSTEKGRIHIPLATGVVGLVAQSLNLAAGKSFVAVEAAHLAERLQRVLQRLTGAQAQDSASSAVSDEQQQAIKQLQSLHRNITEISANLNPGQSGILNINVSGIAIPNPNFAPGTIANAIAAQNQF